MKSTLRLAAAAVAILAIAGTQAQAARVRHHHQAVVTCDQRGCSDWATSAKAGPAHASARKWRQRERQSPVGAQRAPRAPLDANANRAGRSITVHTAAGIAIEVDLRFAAQAQAVIADLVAGGYRPHRIKCLSFAKSHTTHSYHKRGGGMACDVDQSGWGKSPVPRALMRAATARHGVRDGCEFGDHGHFDLGPHLDRRRVLRHCGAVYADAVLGHERLAGRGRFQ